MKVKTFQGLARISALILLVTAMGITGCATNRGVVSLQLPDSTIETETNGEEVYIESVIDQRVFQENPKTQDIPSLGFGGSADATDDIKKRAIARKRNGFGKALGDILLEEGQTVETVITAALNRSFLETGYKIISDEKNISENTIIVKATIEKFWAYMTPGFWAITLSSDIATDIDLILNGTSSKTVSVHSDGKYQLATEANWMEIIDLAVQKYMSELKKEVLQFQSSSKS